MSFAWPNSYEIQLKNKLKSIQTETLYPIPNINNSTVKTIRKSLAPNKLLNNKIMKTKQYYTTVKHIKTTIVMQLQRT